MEEKGGESASFSRSFHSRDRRRKRRKKPLFQNTGIIKIQLSPETQTFVHCRVDEDVSIENPWTNVKKDLVEEHLLLFEDASEFHNTKHEILEYPHDDILVGYTCNQDAIVEEFYFCLTENARDTVNAFLLKQKRDRDMSLGQCVERTSRPWKNLDSDKEVEADMNLNNRALYEVEIETRYPIMFGKVRFELRKVEDARDGYAELLSKASGVLPKRCISTYVQVKPLTMNNSAQTICTYPKNVWTQYEYTFQIDENPSEEFKKSISRFIDNHFSRLNETLRLNSFINLYDDDYNKLVKDPKNTVTPLFIRIKEHMSFTDINMCKNKRQSCVSWHHFWSGVLVSSYMDVAPNINIREKSNVDEVTRIIYGVNPVLLWSFADALHPRLYLEASREVSTVSCCPFDENIVVGGMTNGQIIIWDIKNRLNKVEEEEILTPAQVKYRIELFGLIGWMLNIRNIGSVRITAVSDLMFSHTDVVTEIEWVSPYHEITKTGQMKKLPDNYPHKNSMQFATCSLDGTVMFWDLYSKPQHSGEYRSDRKLRRLKKKPSALSVDVSPFHILNRALRPHYKLEVFYPHTSIPLPVTHLELNEFDIEYRMLDMNLGKTEFDRSFFQPQFIMRDVEAEILIGTTNGAIIEAYWEGFEYSSSAVVSSEPIKRLRYVEYHDGPITNIRVYNPNPDIVLTVGGKVFAVWHKKYPKKPILWRKSKQQYTDGSWSKRSLHMIRLTRSDGNVELWDIMQLSSRGIAEQTVSGQTLLLSHSQPMTHAKPVVGIADHNGSYRMYQFPTSLVRGTPERYQAMTNYIEKEMRRKQNMQKWERQWMEREHFNRSNMDMSTLNVTKSVIIEKPEQDDKPLRSSQTKKSRVEVIPPSEYSRVVYEKWVEKEKERMNAVLLSLKRLNPELVRKQQAPLKKIEKEKEAKKKKQRLRLQRADKIFNETVGMYFPNALQMSPPPPLNPYAGGDSEAAKQVCVDCYEELTSVVNEYIQENPFRYRFIWSQLIKQAMERRDVLDKPYRVSFHRLRFQTQLKEATSSTPVVEPPVSTIAEEDTKSEPPED